MATHGAHGAHGARRHGVVGLHRIIQGEPVRAFGAAAQAAVHHHEPFGLGHDPDRLHQATAVGGPVAGVDVEVHRPQAGWTVVAETAGGQRADVRPAVAAGEG